MGRIHKLSETLINQIAAGEVVERPASVVKELVENALDAGATHITVELLGGGRELIAVEDDGCGMDRPDALLALERHATSKLSDAAQLERIATLGFRGEALPSIAAVSRLTLETAMEPGDGCRVLVEFGAESGVEPLARPRGTRIEIRDLFEQLPARQKFLRTEGTELRHALAMVTALAVTHPTVAFEFRHGPRTLLRLPPAADLPARLPDLVGPERARKAAPVSLQRGAVAVAGVLVPPSGAREIVVAVNGRAVRDRLLIGTINRALRDASGRAEADAYIAITVPPDAVDVNVHPTKAEVRFRDPGVIVSALTAALASARAAAHEPGMVRHVLTAPAPAPGPARPWGGGPARDGAGPSGLPWIREAPQIPFAPTGPAPAPLATVWGRYLGQYRETYLVLEDPDGLLLVDQHNAHERVLFDRLAASPHRPPVQRLLIPEILELSPSQAILVEQHGEELAALGVDLEPMSGATLRVLGVPSPLPVERSAELVAALLRDLVDEVAPGETLRERIAASLACRAAIKKNRPMAPAEAERLLADLAATRDPHRCPHGRPITLRLAHDEIERRIGRR